MIGAVGVTSPFLTEPDVLVSLFTALTLGLLGIAVPLVWAAVRGYRGTPWGRVIEPLPWIVGSLFVWAVVALLPLSIWAVGTVAAATWGVATVGIVLIGWRAYRLFTGQVKL